MRERHRFISLGAPASRPAILKRETLDGAVSGAHAARLATMSLILPLWLALAGLLQGCQYEVGSTQPLPQPGSPGERRSQNLPLLGYGSEEVWILARGSAPTERSEE